MQDPNTADPKVYRCACGWSGQLQHLSDGKNCQNCGRQLAGDNEAADPVPTPATPPARKLTAVELAQQGD